MPARHGPRHGRATDERWRRTAARTGLEGRSASAGRDRRNRRARIALTAFSEPGWCPDTPPLKRHRGRRWRFSAVRSTNVGSRPALCTAAPPLLPALADHLPVCGSPALATIRSDGELRNGSHRLQRALSRRRHRLSPDRSADAVAKDDQLSARRAGVPRAPGALELTRFGGRVTSAVRDSVAERTVLPTEPVRQANGTRCRPSPGRGDGVEDGTLQPSGR